MYEPHQPSVSPDDSLIRSGFVSIVGRPNTGKSTFVNAAVGSKIAITSNTAQTTRHRLMGIVNTFCAQIVLVDTPGLHKPLDALGVQLNKTALSSLGDVDVVCMAVPADKQVGRGDAWIAQHLKRLSIPKILLVTKTDLVKDTHELNQTVQDAMRLLSFDEVIHVHAYGKDSDQSISLALERLSTHLPQGPRWFPPEMTTDQPLEILIAEFIREKILYNTSQEVPHAVGVDLDDLTYESKKKLYKIYATIYVERESQKGIIIGAHGGRLKTIGQSARLDLERLLGKRVFLDLHVKIKQDWRRDMRQIRRFGYTEGL